MGAAEQSGLEKNKGKIVISSHFPQNLFPCTILPCKYITTWYIFLKWGNMGQSFRLGTKVPCAHLEKNSISSAMPGSCGP